MEIDLILTRYVISEGRITRKNLVRFQKNQKKSRKIKKNQKNQKKSKKSRKIKKNQKNQEKSRKIKKIKKNQGKSRKIRKNQEKSRKIKKIRDIFSAKFSFFFSKSYKRTFIFDFLMITFKRIAVIVE